MCASKDQNVRIARSVLKDFIHIDMSDLFSNSMLYPAFFHQGYKKRARLFRGLQALMV